jgi:hypothetical protein
MMHASVEIVELTDLFRTLTYIAQEGSHIQSSQWKGHPRADLLPTFAGEAVELKHQHVGTVLHQCLPALQEGTRRPAFCTAVISGKSSQGRELCIAAPLTTLPARRADLRASQGGEALLERGGGVVSISRAAGTLPLYVL